MYVFVALFINFVAISVSSTLHLKKFPALFGFIIISLRVPPRPHMHLSSCSGSTVTTLSTLKHINVDQYGNDKFYCNIIK